MNIKKKLNSYVRRQNEMSDVHSWCTSISKFTMSVCHHIEKKKKREERHLYRTNFIKKKSCSDNDYVDDDAIVIIKLDQYVIFHFLTYTLMD